jgi:hypothetical protein
MKHFPFSHLASLSIVGVLLGSTTSAVRAVLFSNFAEAGTTVNGYQDDFNGGTLNSSWVEIDGGNDDGPLFQLSGIGSLTMLPAAGDPNKLLYNLLNDQVAWGPSSAGNDWTAGS